MRLWSQAEIRASGACNRGCSTATGTGDGETAARDFKKSLQHIEPGKLERFTLMEKMEKENYTIKELCTTFEISRSGYYAHKCKEEGLRQRSDVELSMRIQSTFQQSRRTYGTRRIRILLAREGRFCSRRCIARLMKTNGLSTLRKGRFRPRTTDSRHHHPIAPNRLLPQVYTTPPAAEQTWVADITYLQTGEGWHYLAAEMNLGTKRIVGWKTASTLESTLVEGALSRALLATASAPEVHHSDRGSQYAAGSFRSLLNSHGIIPSMSRRANCYDNADMESFWATLKAECFHAGIPASRAEADRLLFDYIETFYNPQRLHSALGYQSPLEYEKSLTLEKDLKNESSICKTNFGAKSAPKPSFGGVMRAHAPIGKKPTNQKITTQNLTKNC